MVTRFDGSTQTLDTAGADIEVYQKSLRQSIIAAIADPNIALVLLVIGALGLYVEFSSPGLIAPGVIGAILVLLGLSAFSVLPINWLGAALLLLALALFVLEAKFASHGILGVGGAAAMVMGAVMLIDSPFPEMRIHWSTAIALALPFSPITVLLLSLVAALAARQSGDRLRGHGRAKPARRSPALAPDGKVFVHGEYSDAVASRPVAGGRASSVKAIDRLKLTVEPVPNEKETEMITNITTVCVIILVLYLLDFDQDSAGI